MEILSRIQTVFRDVFDDEELCISRETTSDDIEDWDSLAQISIVSGVENEFGVRFDVSEMIAFDSVGALADIIAQKQNA